VDSKGERSARCPDDARTAGRRRRPRTAASPGPAEREGFVGGSVVDAVIPREREGFVAVPVDLPICSKRAIYDR
jgi:hypothetical protein